MARRKRQRGRKVPTVHQRENSARRACTAEVKRNIRQATRRPWLHQLDPDEAEHFAKKICTASTNPRFKFAGRKGLV